MDYFFILDDLDIEEPIGFPEIELSLLRDDKFHGIVNEASTSTLEFYGVAATYLQNKWETEGVQANVTFTVLINCGAYVLEEVLTGRLNFGKYKESCGDECTVSIPWEKTSCAVTLNARFDQKVDVDKETGADGLTPLQNYAGLAVETELPAHALKTGTAGRVNDEGDVIDLDIFLNYGGDPSVRPTYGVAVDESLTNSQLIPTVFASSDNTFNDPILSPQLLLESDLEGACYDGTFQYVARLKGSFDFNFVNANGSPNPGTTFFFFKAVLGTGEWNEFPPPDPQTGDWDKGLTVINSANINPTVVGDHWSGTFDVTFTGTLNLAEGKGLYNYLVWEAIGGLTDIRMVGNITFDKETEINVLGIKLCPATTAELYMVHETLSRLTESVTNGCARVQSQYYGRIDSEPFSFPVDGCGGLRTVTSGLKIRKAVEDKFFTSPQDLIEGLNAIDNIGFDVIDDTERIGNSIVRVENVEYFYQDQELLVHDFIPHADKETEETKFYSKVNVGYKKWEVNKVNGLGEFNSNRQYNTSIDTINSTLEITSNLVAGTIPIEVTRQQSFAASGGADTSYDNEVFIICMRRTTYPYGNIEVERDNIDNPDNIFSPETVYNFRISPVRNLMRWYKTLSAAFAAVSSSLNQLFFASGTGNFTAAGMLDDPSCRLENAVLRENQNLFVTNFADQAEATPIWRNELITYEYPMTVQEYQKVRANPYGYITLQCGNKPFQQAYIKEIKFKLAKGVATFILRKKYAV